VPCGSIYNNIRYYVFKIVMVKGFKDEILAAVCEILDVEDVLHRMADEGIEAVASSLSGG
jgi:hypothetical protein